MQNDVFISYSSKDTDTANKILNFLESKGLKCWIAHRDISPGANYGEVLMKNITMSKVVVLVLSRDSNHSQQVIREIERAVSKRITIIPFRIEDVQLSDAMEYFISTHQWLEVNKPLTNEVLEKLSQTIYQVIGSAPPENSQVLEDRSSTGIFKRISGYKKYLLLIAVIGVIIVGIVLIQKYFRTPPSSFSLALLPFEQIDINHPLQSNIKEELYDRLHRYEGLTLYPIDSLRQNDDRQTDFEKTLGSITTRFILTGKIRPEGAHLKYTIIITDRSTSPPKDIWTSTFESGSTINQSRYNTLSRQIYLCIQLETSRWKDLLSGSLFELYKSGQLWLTDDNPNSLQEAEANFRAIIRKDSTISGAYSALAQTLFYEYEETENLKILEEAREYSQKSISLDSTNSGGYSVLGMISRRTGDERNGIQLLTHAIELNPNDIPAFCTLGIIYLTTDTKESKFYFLRAKQLDPATPVNYTNLAAAYYSNRNYNEAHQTLREALKLDSTYYVTWKSLGAYYERKEMFDSAIVSFVAALRHNPNDCETRDYLASLLILTEDLKTARDILKVGIQADPHIYQLKYLYGVLCQLETKNNEAKKYWNDGLQYAKQTALKDGLPESFMYLGLFHGRLGEPKKALSYGQQAVSLDSSNSDILLGMARIYAILKDKAQMILWLTRGKEQAFDIDEAYLKTTIDFRDYIKDSEVLSIVRK